MRHACWGEPFRLTERSEIGMIRGNRKEFVHMETVNALIGTSNGWLYGSAPVALLVMGGVYFIARLLGETEGMECRVEEKR